MGPLLQGVAAQFGEDLADLAEQVVAVRSAEGTQVLRQERFFGKFSRVLNLPTPVAADKVKAQYKDGILTVTLAKVEEAKPKQIIVSE